MKAKTFIDQVVVQVRSGRGGDGSMSFRREALVEFGGPDGGDGGRGGDVVFKASEHVNSLLSLYYDPKCIAQDGGPGQGQKMFGKRGKKVLNFKAKRRKGYRRLVGHRQSITVATVKAIA